MRLLVPVVLAAAVAACGAEGAPTPDGEPTAALAAPEEATAPVAGALDPRATARVEERAIGNAEAELVPFQLDAWSDNWFAAYLGEELLVEASVPITTERSFNAETVRFEARYPLHLRFVLKDFIENDTGLEYIGSGRQQMGDGGFVMQLTDRRTGEVVADSDADLACTVIHEAPLDKACEDEADPVAGTAPCEFVDRGEPEGWKAIDFDDGAWTSATVHSVASVAPKGGYDEISWDDSAELVWGPDLETDNTMLCRRTVLEP